MHECVMKTKKTVLDYKKWSKILILIIFETFGRKLYTDISPPRVDFVFRSFLKRQRNL